MENKTCNKCKLQYDKTLENFHARKTSPDGFSTICKSCVKVLKSRDIKHWDDNKLLCLCCKEYKDSCLFDTNNKNLHRLEKDRRCKSCKQKQHKRRKENNRGKKDLNRLLLERWHGLKDRAKKSDVIIDFKSDFLLELWNKQNGLCNISKINMTYIMNNGRIPTNLSVDRIDSSKSYLKDNIQLVCMAVNQMKSDLSNEQLLYFCQEIIKNNKI